MKTFSFWLTRIGVVIGWLLVAASLQEPLVERSNDEALRLLDIGGFTGLAFLAWLLPPVVVAALFAYAIVLLPSPRPARRARWANAGYLLSVGAAIGMVVITALVHAELKRADESVRVAAALPMALVGLAFGATSMFWEARARD